MIVAPRFVRFAAVVLISGIAGWLLHTPESTAALAPVPSEVPAQVDHKAQSTPVSVDPLIAVSSDGNVTLRVEQQPLEWVLDQIALQSGWGDVKQRAHATTPVAPTGTLTGAAGVDAPSLTPSQADGLLQTIERGSDSDRIQGLLQARTAGVSVPDDVLKTLYQTSASDRVRLLAFEAYLDLRLGDNRATREALQTALYVPNGAIQREARQRLEELAESEPTDSAAVPNDNP
jgi:hypothetical protein